MTQTITEADEIVAALDDYNMAAKNHGGDTVTVERDDNTMSMDGVQAIAERNGFFVFATEPHEVTLQSYESCPWKSQ